jgi:hypothetical protein
MSESNIISIQQEFKKNLMEKMKIQNKRYLNSLKIIEKIMKKNQTLKTIKKRNSNKKTKTKKRSPSISNKNNKDFTQNIEIKSMFKKIDTALNNIIDVIDHIKRNKYLNKIQNFISKKDEPTKILLMESIQIINSYMESNMNITQGVLVDIKHKEVFELLDQILKQNKIEENLKELEQINNKITKTKKNRLNTIYISDIEKLESKLLKTSRTLERENINIGDFRFTYKEGSTSFTINLNQIKEKIKDCIEFIEKENKFA